MLLSSIYRCPEQLKMGGVRQRLSVPYFSSAEALRAFVREVFSDASLTQEEGDFGTRLVVHGLVAATLPPPTAATRCLFLLLLLGCCCCPCCSRCFQWCWCWYFYCCCSVFIVLCVIGCCYCCWCRCVVGDLGIDGVGGNTEVYTAVCVDPREDAVCAFVQVPRVAATFCFYVRRASFAIFSSTQPMVEAILKQQ